MLGDGVERREVREVDHECASGLLITKLAIIDLTGNLGGFSGKSLD